MNDFRYFGIFSHYSRHVIFLLYICTKQLYPKISTPVLLHLRYKFVRYIFLCQNTDGNLRGKRVIKLKYCPFSPKNVSFRIFSDFFHFLPNETFLVSVSYNDVFQSKSKLANIKIKCTHELRKGKADCCAKIHRTMYFVVGYNFQSEL